MGWLIWIENKKGKGIPNWEKGHLEFVQSKQTGQKEKMTPKERERERERPWIIGWLEGGRNYLVGKYDRNKIWCFYKPNQSEENMMILRYSSEEGEHEAERKKKG